MASAFGAAATTSSPFEFPVGIPAQQPPPFRTNQLDAATARLISVKNRAAETGSEAKYILLRVRIEEQAQKGQYHLLYDEWMSSWMQQKLASEGFDVKPLHSIGHGPFIYEIMWFEHIRKSPTYIPSQSLFSTPIGH